jgi:hypothetical protein
MYGLIKRTTSLSLLPKEPAVLICDSLIAAKQSKRCRCTGRNDISSAQRQRTAGLPSNCFYPAAEKGASAIYLYIPEPTQVIRLLQPLIVKHLDGK